MNNEVDVRRAGEPGSVSRREFLKVGGLAGLSVGLSGGPGVAAGSGSSPASVIFILMVGGPSQLETFDPKPDAPSEIRGPFASIDTAVPGVRIVEHLPRLARRMNKLALVRTLRHDEAPIHETGLQLVQTGRLSRNEDVAPHFGAVIAERLGARRGASPFVVLPGLLGPTGVAIPQGQGEGFLDSRLAPTVEPATAFEGKEAEAYGTSAFGRRCLQARRLVESGTRVVTINMAASVFNQVSWDAHGGRPFSGFRDYRRELLPTFDQGVSALIDDLDRRGLLDSTLIVATGEFGRNPKINAQGGRDHWPACWSALLAGGGVAGGQVIGRSDRRAAEPIDRPVRPVELLATIYEAVGVDRNRPLTLADGSVRRILEDDPAPLGRLV